MERIEFWQNHLRTLSDADLCGVTARGLHRDELRGLLEVMCERGYHTAEGPIREFRRFDALCDIWFNKWQPYCVGCGADIHAIGEYFIVADRVWNQAWIGRHRSPVGDGQLCIGCLEQRLGRTLMSCDFEDVPINDLSRPFCQRSDRLRDRLTTKTGSVKGADGLVAWAVEGMLEKLPEHQRAAARASWERMNHER